MLANHGVIIVIANERFSRVKPSLCEVVIANERFLRVKQSQISQTGTIYHKNQTKINRIYSIMSFYFNFDVLES